MNLPRIVAIGICVVDIYVQEQKMYPGGNEYNICHYVQEVGGEASFMGVFADDRVGEILSSLCLEKGIDLSHSRFVHGCSGYALVDIVNGDRIFLDWNKKGVTDLYPIHFTEEDLAFIKTHDVAAISYASRLDRQSYATLSATGIPVSYDFSDSFTPEQIRDYCPLFTFSFFSASHLGQDEIRSLLWKAVACKTRYAVATMGKRGAIGFDGDKYCEVPAPEVAVVDTMGAGDAFIAAFLVDYCEQKKGGTARLDLHQALAAGSLFSGRVIQRKGSLGIGYDVDMNHLSTVLNL